MHDDMEARRLRNIERARERQLSGERPTADIVRFREAWAALQANLPPRPTQPPNYWNTPAPRHKAEQVKPMRHFARHRDDDHEPEL